MSYFSHKLFSMYIFCILKKTILKLCLIYGQIINIKHLITLNLYTKNVLTFQIVYKKCLVIFSYIQKMFCHFKLKTDNVFYLYMYTLIVHKANGLLIF